MKKTYDKFEYSEMAKEANKLGKKLYILVTKNELNQELASLIIADYGYYICYESNYTRGELNPNYELEKQTRRRSFLDSLKLTPADVERALFEAKGMDFDDLKMLIQQAAPNINIKRIGIELKANNFFRGATIDNVRLIDTIGALLGYTSEDMDYLFLNKKLPQE